MSEKNIIKCNNVNIKTNFYILSSWNYGSYSPTNPFYKSNFNFYSSKLLTTNPSIKANKKQESNISSYSTVKQISKSKSKIVTNDLLENYIFDKNMKKHFTLGTFNPRNIYQIMKQKKEKEKENKSGNNNGKIRKMKTDISEFKYKLNFTEWLNIKNKQIKYFRKLIKKNEEEEKIRDEKNKKIEVKYNLIKEKKFKEWCYKKNVENILKKEITKQLESYKEKERKEKLKQKEEVMNSWFKAQAEKIEKEIEEKKKKKVEEKKEKIRKKKEIEEKQKKGKEAFQKWKELKEQEMKIKKRKENINKKKEEEKKRREYLKRRVKSFIIGPYTDAAALREIQNNLMENNLNNSDFDM
jgi:hypothetical protein